MPVHKSPNSKTKKIFPSKYEVEVEERRDFRNRMKHELKVLAKESFFEEIERLKVNNKINNNDRDSMDNERTEQMLNEIHRLQLVVDDLRSNNPNVYSPMQVEWSNPFVRDQFGGSLPPLNNPQNYPFGNTMNGGMDSFYPASKLEHNQPEDNTNKLFILSAAPINSFDQLLRQEGQTDMKLSLSEQANRMAEMQSLFQLPTQLSEDNSLLMLQESLIHEKEIEKQKKLAVTKAQREKVQNMIENHKDRLDKSRQQAYRFPLNSKPSGAQSSPRLKIHRNLETPKSSGENLMSGINTPQVPQTPMMGDYSTAFPPSAISTAPTPAVPSSTVPTIETPGTTNKPPETLPSSPKAKAKIPTITIDEFATKTDKMSEDLKKLIRDVVHDEMVNDCRAQHYTKRFQKQLMASKHETLVDKIEKAVGDKIETLQKELDHLRNSKLIKGKKNINDSTGDGQDDFDDDEDDEEDNGPRKPIFTRAELAALKAIDGNLDIKALSVEINKSVQHAIKKVVSGGGKRSYSSSDEEEEEEEEESPNSSSIHGRIGGDANDNRANDNKDSIGFDAPTSPTDQPVRQASVISTNSNPTNVAKSRSMGGGGDDGPTVTRKSKADRLLGINTDPKSGIPVNAEPGVSTKHGGLFGSIGSLFGSKPTGPSVSNSMISERFGVSNRPHSTVHAPVATTHIAHPPVVVSHTPTNHAPQPKPALETMTENDNEDGESAHSTRKSSRHSKKLSVSIDHVSGKTLAEEMNPQLVADIVAEETNYRNLMSNLLGLADVKMNIKKELKDWQKNFEDRFGREPTLEDKAAINDRFIAYRMVCDQVQEAKDMVKASEEKLKELKDKK